MIETSEYMIDRPLNNTDSQIINVEESLYDTGNFEIKAYACGKLYSRNLWEQIRFPEGMIFEDFYLVPEIMLRAGTIAETTERLYYYYQRPDSTVYSRKDSQYIENKWKGYERLIQLFEEHNEKHLAEIMKRAYVFWTATILSEAIPSDVRKIVVKRGRSLIRRYSEVSGYPFYLNKELLFSLYPIIGGIYKRLSKTKRVIQKRVRTRKDSE